MLDNSTVAEIMFRHIFTTCQSNFKKNLAQVELKSFIFIEQMIANIMLSKI